MISNDAPRVSRCAAQCWATRMSTARIAQTTPLTSEFQDLITRYAWGEIWTRPGLDIRSRRILVIGTMIAIGRWEEFQMHAAAAIREGGFTLDDREGDRAAAGRSIAACRPRITR